MPSANETPSRINVTPSGFFALRTPLLPFCEILAWSEGTASVRADAGQLDQALASDRALLQHRLRLLLERPEIREAIFLASPDLATSIPFWSREPTSERGQRIEKAAVRYVLRMASRCTPFGLFAGCSVASLGGPTRLELGPRVSYLRHTRLDMDYLFALADHFQRQPQLGRLMVVRPNSSLYRLAGRFRYAEAKLQGKQRTYNLVAVDDNEYVRATLERARGSARPDDLAAALVAQDPEITLPQAQAFIDELIANQILLTDLVPAVTGPEPTQGIVSQLAGATPLRSLAETLAGCVTSLQRIDEAGLGADPKLYRDVASDLASLPVKAELARLFQVDMVKPAPDLALGETVIAEVVRGVRLLHRLGRWSAGPSNLERFREAFLARYEAREVPLVEALDEELGVGFESAGEAGAEATPLLEGLAFRPEPVGVSIEWHDWQSHLLLLWETAVRRGLTELVLTPEDVDRLSVKQPLPLPDAFAISATLAADSERALARGDFQIYLAGGRGPSGVRLLGRFCHADPRLQQFVRDHLRAEEAMEPGAIFAEIVHLPEARIGNVLSRPVLRDYEIPFLGRSAAPPNREIPITDLLVSIQGDQIVLRSRTLGRRIVPRLSTAHNYYVRSLRLYKFLCSLQDHGRTGTLGWDWGIFKYAQFLPRVRMGRLVLHRACWRLDPDQLQALGRLSGVALFKAVQALRAERGLPRWVLFSEGDSELLVDFDNVLCIETLIDLVKGRPRALLFELFPGPEQLLARGPEGRFTHELVIPFICKKESVPSFAAAPLVHALRRASRTLVPGSEWLFAKLYTGAATADQVLREVVGPVSRDAMAHGSADGWFFLRYGDPDWHVRLRLHGSPDRLRYEVMPRVEEALRPLSEDGRVRKLQYDTYDREVERYGGPEGVRLAERIFQADSEAVLGIVDLFIGDAGMDARWRLTLRGIDMLLDNMGLTWSEKRAVIKHVRESYARHFPGDPHQLGTRFRKEKASLERLLDRQPDDADVLAPGVRLLYRRAELLVPIVAELRAAVSDQRVALPLPVLCSSFIHLHANRLLRSAHRAQEFVIYSMLDRLYQSMEARKGT